MLTRREVCRLLVGSGLLVSSDTRRTPAASLFSAQGTNQAIPDLDLLIKGGTVIDPSQNLHAPLDVAVKGGRILQLAADIPTDRALRVVSAEGRIVTPGLIDVHVHVFEGVGPTGLNADQYCLGRGVTTAIDAGSTGHDAGSTGHDAGSTGHDAGTSTGTDSGTTTVIDGGVPGWPH